MYPPKEKLGQKWWHRLANVVIASCTVAAFLLSFFIIYESKQRNFILNFEDGYANIQGGEIDFTNVGGEISATQILDRIVATYPSKPLTFSEFTSQVDAYGRLAKYFFPEYNDLTDKELGQKFILKYPDLRSAITEIRQHGISDAEAYSAIVNTELGSKLKVKEWDSYSPEVFLWFLSPIVVYLLLRLVYYRVILYVILGKDI